VPIIQSGRSTGVELNVYGLQQTERALKAIAPEVGKALDKAIRQALNKTRDAARGRIPDTPPMSGWRTGSAARGRARGGAGWPGWDAGKARAGIKVGKGQARGRRLSSVAVAWRVQSSDGAGTIFDKSAQGHSPVGEQFVRNLDRFSKAQRVLWPAWLATRDEALRTIEVEIHHAESVVQRFIDAEGRGAA
jgi:hypothetical protein